MNIKLLNGIYNGQNDLYLKRESPITYGHRSFLTIIIQIRPILHFQLTITFSTPVQSEFQTNSYYSINAPLSSQATMARPCNCFLF